MYNVFLLRHAPEKVAQFLHGENKISEDLTRFRTKFSLSRCIVCRLYYIYTYIGFRRSCVKEINPATIHG